MATSTIPAAIDYLYEYAVAMPECAYPVVVCDGWPDEGADTGFVIGVVPDDPDSTAEKTHAQLGAQTEWEEYRIPCIIWARRAGVPRPMRDARLAVFAIFDAFDTHLRTTAGRTLGGVLRSSSAIIADLQLRQTDDAKEAGDGRQAHLEFTVVCKSRSER